MTLHEADAKLAGLNEKIDDLLKKRESILKEWSIAFHAENPENITCIDENIGDCHNLYLASGDFKMHVCRFSDFDLKGSLDDFYRKINNALNQIGIKNRYVSAGA